MIQPHFTNWDFGYRIGARYGLDFFIEFFHSTPYLRERGEYGSHEDRDPTGPELAMWEQLVSPQDREHLNGLMLLRDPPVVEATPEELYSALIYQKAVYLNAADLAVARRLRDFEPENARDRLLEGQFGQFRGETAVFVSREVPQGYFYPSEGRVPEFHFDPPPGERQVRPPLDPEFEIAASMDLRMFRVNPCDIPSEPIT